MERWRTNTAAERYKRGAWLTSGAIAAVLGSALSAAAQLPPPPTGPANTASTAPANTATVVNTINTATAIPKARIIEWDLPSAGDANPGAMVVDTQGYDKDRNRLWFITRTGDPAPRVYRMDFPKSLTSAWAHWTAWQLSELSIITGGADHGRGRKVRSSKDRRYVYVRSVFTVERIDTQNCDAGSNTCERVVWPDRIDDPGEFDTSDLTVDDWNTVYWTHAVNPGATDDQSYVERMAPASSSSGPATITRWAVGGGAGMCPSAGELGSPCLSGIAVHPTNRNLVYYSEPWSNKIAELNVYTNHVRRWDLAQLPPTEGGTPVREPRQLHIDRWGKVWVVTGSGHLVSLDPCTNRLTRHQMPDQDTSDPFGLGPDDDVVGYTVSASTHNKVGVLFPKGTTISIVPEETDVLRSTYTVTPTVERAAVDSGSVPPVGKTVAVQLTKKTDGTFIEAQLNTCPPDADQSTCVVNDSMQPLGITPVKAKSEGTFFYAVGQNASTSGDPNRPSAANRVGFVRFPVFEKVKHPRDDDDENDGEGDHGQHGWHDHAGHHDADDDGVTDDNDQHDKRERDARADQNDDDSAPMAPGASKSYSMVASPTSLALIAMSTPGDPLAYMSIEIYDALGMLVTRSAPTPGVALTQVALPAAGTYTCVIRNSGTTSVTQVPTLLVREPWN
jgi:hypothetical protein